MRNNLNISILSLTGFSLNTIFAIVQKWSLQEFCWSTWLAALFFSWSCMIVSAVRIILSPVQQKKMYEPRMTFLKNMPTAIFYVLLYLVVIAVVCVVFYLYCYLFFFYGLFLSFFAEMEPHSYFGRNGFINSDLFSPVMYLLLQFWPMILGLIISNFEVFRKSQSWRLMVFPFQSGDIIKIHMMIVVMPFICLLVWALFKDHYQPITITLLMALFYLFPIPKKKSAMTESL